MEFIDWLNKEMSSRELSQNKLAKMAGISQGAIGHVLAGRRGSTYAIFTHGSCGFAGVEAIFEAHPVRYLGSAY